MENFVGLILAAFTLLITFLLWYRRNALAPLNWPIAGMLPSLLWNLSNFYEWATALLNTNGGTIKFSAGVCSTNFQIMTCNPLNLEYILDKTKRPASFGEVEESLRDVIALTLSRSGFNLNSKQKLVGQKILSALEEAYKKDAALDLQNLLLRFGFDYACLVSLGKEDMAGSLVPEYSRALEDAMEAWAYSVIIPTKHFCQKYMTALKLTQKYASKMVEECRQKQEPGNDDISIFPSFECDCDKSKLQDLFISIVVSCRDMCSSTLCWFLWLVSKHPDVEDNIMLELSEFLDDDKTSYVVENELINGMQYLEAALCETLRLYPPLPLGHMRAMEDNVLPDGTCVEKGSGILCLIYGANRMESVWGEDAGEFKPERWIEGGICVRESNPVFGTVTQHDMDMIKCLAANILARYHVTVEEEEFPVEAKLGMTLLIKYGLQVTLHGREDEHQAAQVCNNDQATPLHI